MKVHPIPHAIFWNHKVKAYPNFASLFSVMKNDSSIIFLVQTSYTMDKNTLGFSVVGWKFTKFLMSFLELRVSFSSKFTPLFSVMKRSSSVFFHRNLCMLWTKGSNQSANFQISDCSLENLPNSLCYFSSHKSVFL